MIRAMAPRSRDRYRVPVKAAPGDDFESTSSDVHLFADPGTASTRVPRFFVDCEGFSGSDNTVSRRLTSRDHRSTLPSRPLHEGTLRQTSSAGFQASDPIQEHAKSASSKAVLKWGRVLAPIDAPRGLGARQVGQVDSESRARIVKTLYPRLLYAFSDVVCFVTNNAKASQSILDQTFQWAKDGHERTLNQRVRPGLIIVLNKMGADSHDGLSSVEEATRRLLSSFQRSTRFRELQSKWRARGRTIENSEQLIYCYYDYFRVVSIPQHTQTSPVIVENISHQLRVLYNEIIDMSANIHRKRQSLNMDLDISDLNAHVHRSISSLGKDLNNSLDFHELSDGDSALPRQFSEHLSQLMARMAKIRHFHTNQAVGGEAELVSQMMPYIAACIMAQISQDDGTEQAQKRKETLVDEARRGLEQFRNRSWRCEATDSSGQRRCKNYSDGHAKGHQFDTWNAPLRSSTDVSYENLEQGSFQSSYDPDAITDELWSELYGIKTRAHAIEKLATAATACGVTRVTTQRTCLSCLANTPTNMLPCKQQEHGICEDCIQRSNPTTGHESWINVNSCPLGCSFTTTPWRIRVKPRNAGARILALDGGGVRGIVELAILGEIEKAVGFGIRIQDLFDLVIGTSTGGLVALGVFEKNWTIAEAKTRFYELSNAAFSVRKALAVPILSKIAEPFCAFKYKSAGINKALQSAFEDKPLFGQTDSRSKQCDGVKVGVVACIEGRKQPCLIANYSRNPPDKLKDGREGDDCLQREDEQSKDFLCWQAARATSACPTLFKPYVHQHTERTYLDGAILRNNPVRLAYEEETRIWGQSKRPDIVLSVGTGILIDFDGRLIQHRRPHIESLKNFLPKGIRKKVETGLDMVQTTLDCHEEWQNFIASLRSSPINRNCHRLDVGLINKPPGLDAVDEIHNLRHASEIYLRDAGFSSKHLTGRYSCPPAQIDAIARRLLSSLFYLAGHIDHNMDGGTVRTTLHCRLSPFSGGASAMISDMEGPKFRIREVDSNGEESVRPVRFMNKERFNPQTMSAEVELDVLAGSYTRFVDVQFPTRGKRWDAIGGF
ncbi:hypothetical protein NM208_g5905 [Fusarium decemcellulare]|nr:hypothetical protein NM208_g5905 [Fusarium decemcellulare]